MSDFGHFVLILAAAFCTCSIVADVLASWRNKPCLAVAARYGTIVVFLCLTLAVVILLRLLLGDGFAVDYVASHSSSGLPVLFKISALWAGSGGALLLLLWFQVGFVSIVFFKDRSDVLAFSSRARSIANFVSAFFLQGLIHDKQIFAISAVTPTDGAASCQSLGILPMVFSLVFFITGFAALIIPFAWSFGYFKSVPNTHVDTMLSETRRWSLCALLFLTGGVVLSGWVNYQELGAGGICSSTVIFQMITWLLAIAMFLCYRFYRSRRPTGILAALMSVFTYSLCVYGVFLTRYVYNSDFDDAAHGKFFVVLLIHIWAIAAIMLLRRHFKKVSVHGVF